MTKNIFMSYSRRELGFVDDLVKKLEGENYNVWLDYQALIPGSPWNVQIDKGLKEADTVLLVVSKAAIASEYVALEWRHFLETKKRVLLLIFEAVDLPKELEQYEWVDFRGSYKAGLDELFSQLEKPIQEEHPVPETGFKAPWIVWAAIAISAVVAVISLGAYWTVFIPWLLVPLPYQIFKRSFDFMRVQSALLVLPLALGLDLFIKSTAPTRDGVDVDFLFYPLMLISGWVLLFMLRSPALQRWGKPESTIPKFANPYKPNISNPEPVPFYVDHAPEDRVVAEELTTVLKKYGHPQAENIHSAKAVLALISRFKSDTEASPSSQVVFPVLIQSNDNVSKKLSKVQWIDFRPGVRGLDAIAQLLPDPTEMLKALGVRPVSSLSVYPPMITALYYVTVLLAAVNFGAVTHTFFSELKDILDPSSFAYIISLLLGILIVFAGLAYFMVNGLLTRAGWFAKFPMILGGLVVQGLLMYGLTEFDNYIFELAAEGGIAMGYTFTTFSGPIFFVGILVLLVVYLGNRLDMKRWFPVKKK